GYVRITSKIMVRKLTTKRVWSRKIRHYFGIWHPLILGSNIQQGWLIIAAASKEIDRVMRSLLRNDEKTLFPFEVMLKAKIMLL
ncbi:hypothetical protein CEXT_433241, partial [Caerostris extrusa]